MCENHPVKLPERIPSEPDPPEAAAPAQLKKRRTVKWRLSGFFNLKKLKGKFEGEREVTVEKFDD